MVKEYRGNVSASAELYSIILTRVDGYDELLKCLQGLRESNQTGAVAVLFQGYDKKPVLVSFFFNFYYVPYSELAS